MGRLALAQTGTVYSDGSAADESALLRRVMVDRQLRPFDVTDVPVLDQFLATPREKFLPPDLAPLAYSDMAITVQGSHEGRALLPPLVLARMIQAAEILPTEAVLDVAGATGYSAALLSGLAKRVVALESDPDFVAASKANLAAFGAPNVQVELRGLAEGFAEAAPYDAILIYGAVEDNLDALFAQLAPNGRLLAITKLDSLGGLQVVRYERSGGKAGGERPLFDAPASALQAFRKAPGFVF